MTRAGEQIDENGYVRRTTRATAYLLNGGATAMLAVAVLAALAVSAALCPILIGVPLLAGLLRGGRRLAAAERRRAGRLLGGGVPQRCAEPSGPSHARLRALLRDPATWRVLAWLMLHTVVGTSLAVCCLTLWTFAITAPPAALLWWTPQGGPIDYFVTIERQRQQLRGHHHGQRPTANGQRPTANGQWTWPSVSCSAG
jgi:hypothetical protein